MRHAVGVAVELHCLPHRLAEAFAERVVEEAAHVEELPATGVGAEIVVVDPEDVGCGVRLELGVDVLEHLGERHCVESNRRSGVGIGPAGDGAFEALQFGIGAPRGEGEFAFDGVVAGASEASTSRYERRGTHPTDEAEDLASTPP